MRRVAVLAGLVAVRAAAAGEARADRGGAFRLVRSFRTSSPLTGIINSLRLKRYVIPPHFIIDKYFSEQSSVKDVALQAFSAGIRAVAAAQVSARVAARRRLRSQRKRMFLVAYDLIVLAGGTTPVRHRSAALAGPLNYLILSPIVAAWRALAPTHWTRESMLILAVLLPRTSPRVASGTPKYVHHPMRSSASITLALLFFCHGESNARACEKPAESCIDRFLPLLSAFASVLLLSSLQD